jgi:hypothetical protein
MTPGLQEIVNRLHAHRQARKHYKTYKNSPYYLTCPGSWEWDLSKLDDDRKAFVEGYLDEHPPTERKGE